jgi:mersacidin/lichenicidin family type 2 lantibiotic
MSHENIIRAWKDASFRESLGEKERELMLEHPSGFVEIAESHLREVIGGFPTPTCIGQCIKQTKICPNLLCTEIQC